MSYVVLARKWRPQQFGDVLGQEHVTQTLTNAIASNRIAHAFLFSGPRGVGKTSAARILSKALCCEAQDGPTATPCGVCRQCQQITDGRSTDVFEIDAASHTGVDNVREIIDNVRYLPSAARYKIYVVDEVHMLSTGAFNALLKTLEEPPAHVKFVLATTDVHKVPVTILSRCQRYDFRRIALSRIAERLSFILTDEGIEHDPSALTLVAREAEGSMRDAQSLLEQVLAFAGPRKLDGPLVRDALGVVDAALVGRSIDAILARRPGEIIEIVSDVHERGLDLSRFADALVEHVRDLLVARLVPAPANVLDRPSDEVASLVERAKSVPSQELERVFEHLCKAVEEVGRAPHPRFVLEVQLASIAEAPARVPVEALLEELHAVQARLDGGGPPPRGGGGGGFDRRNQDGPRYANRDARRFEGPRGNDRREARSSGPRREEDRGEDRGPPRAQSSDSNAPPWARYSEGSGSGVEGRGVGGGDAPRDRQGRDRGPPLDEDRGPAHREDRGPAHPGDRGPAHPGDRGPSRDDRGGSHRDDRSLSRDDRGGSHHDDRGPSRDDRGGSHHDDRGPSRDDRGGSHHDDRGPSRDDRGGSHRDARGPAHHGDRGGSNRDDRGGSHRDDRGPSHQGDRGPPEDDRYGPPPSDDDRYGPPPGYDDDAPPPYDDRGGPSGFDDAPRDRGVSVDALAATVPARFRAFVDLVKKKRPPLAATLVQVRPLAFEKGHVELGCETKFDLKKLEDADTKATLEAFLAEYFGAPTRLEVRHTKGGVAPSEVNPATLDEVHEAGRAQSRRDKERTAKAHPAVKAIEGELGGEIAKVRVLDEGS